MSNVRPRNKNILSMAVRYRVAIPDDIAECVTLRARTRENAVSAARLRAAGITVESWAEHTRAGTLIGTVCLEDAQIVGYCFGAPATGEVVVLAILPTHERQGIGRTLLAHVTSALSLTGHARLFLGCSPDPSTRSHGFYRYLGWRSTGRFDAAGDEVLEYLLPGPRREA